jgi:hypothetical protein
MLTKLKQEFSILRTLKLLRLSAEVLVIARWNKERQAMVMELLTRDEFRRQVFERDHHECVICGLTAKDAHHIIERRLWDDGGYYLDNGASLCSVHHYMAETTCLPCDEIRMRIPGISLASPHLPPHLYDDCDYDKWGNIIRPDGTRVPGELFGDESVQKILKEGNMLCRFVHYIKYPRTFHLPWSPGLTKDDRVMQDVSGFEGEDIVQTLKMDGENTSMYRDYIHARSIDSGGHESRCWVKNFHAHFAHDIPKGWRICGENLYAKHSIHYQNLSTYFMVFSIWDENNTCLSWQDTKEWCELLGLATVPVLYEGKWDEAQIKSSYPTFYNNDEIEGYVVRLAKSFHYAQFRRSVAKYVRANHVHTHNFWAERVIKNNMGVGSPG